MQRWAAFFLWRHQMPSPFWRHSLNFRQALGKTCSLVLHYALVGESRWLIRLQYSLLLNFHIHQGSPVQRPGQVLLKRQCVFSPKISERHKDKHRSIKNPRRGTRVGIHIWGLRREGTCYCTNNNQFTYASTQMFS